MTRLEFRFSQIVEEIDALSQIANGFIDKLSSDVLKNLKTELEGIRAAPSGRHYFWNIKEEYPLTTITSFGGYEPNDQGAHNVFASITSTWEIEPLGNHNTGSRIHRKFALAGIASTRVRIYKGSPDKPLEELAMWRMEIGDVNSPGCHFHVQVLGEEDNPPFPHSLSVPRFPGIIFTPMATFEFVLGEVFQDQWRQIAASESGKMQTWLSIQRQRLVQLLQWQKGIVEDSTGSPWIALKSAKPVQDIFIP
jgi:hypothetical protein